MLFALPIVTLLGILAATESGLVRTRRTSVFQQYWFLLVVLVAVSGALRLLVAHYASYNPDEYATWEIVKMHPWRDVLDFLRNYHEIPVFGKGMQPPLSYLLMAVGYQALPSLEGPRLVSVALSLVTIPIVYCLLSLIFDREIGLLVSAVYALIPQTVVFLSLALTDAYVFFFGLVALTTFVLSVKHKARLQLLVSGLFLGLAFWSKLGIPFFWAFAILLSAIFLKWRTRKERMLSVGACYIAGGAVLAVYYLVARASFWVYIAHNFAIPQVAIRNFLSYPLNQSVGTGTVFPAIVGGAENPPITYLGLLLQLLAWFTPLTLLAGLIGGYSVIRRKDRRATWILLWGLAPFLALIPYYRDIRYLLICSIPLATLAVFGLRQFPRLREERIVGIVLVFLVVGSISFTPLVQQEYAGIREASEVLVGLGLSNQVILTNAPQLSFYLPKANVLYLAPNSTPDSIHALFSGRNVSVVVLLHQRRGAWALPTQAVLDLLRAYFTNRTTSSPSSYSWCEILYSPNKQPHANVTSWKPSDANANILSVGQTTFASACSSITARILQAISN